MKRKLFLGFVVVALVALFAAVPCQALQGEFTVRAEKQAKLQAQLEALRAEIAANGYTFTVGPNPAVQYELEQLCNFRPDLPLPTRHMYDTMENLPDRATALPSSYMGYYTSIKDQGSCGSCWAFAAVGLLECMVLKKDGIEVDLSEQYMLSCNPWGWGCGGGFWPNDMLADPGAAMETCFPYVATEVPCQPCPTPYQVQSWAFVTEDNVMPPHRSYQTGHLHLRGRTGRRICEQRLPVVHQWGFQRLQEKSELDQPCHYSLRMGRCQRRLAAEKLLGHRLGRKRLHVDRLRMQ
jgi:hypothetical protein